MTRHSELQLKVLKLYKQLLVAARGKDGFRSFIQKEFRQNSSIPRKDFLQIEYLFRRGERQLIMLKREGIQRLGMFYKDNLDDIQSKNESTKD